MFGTVKESFKVFYHTFTTDFSHIIKDPGVLLILFGASLFYPIVYSLAYSKEVVADVPVAVVDLSSTKSSRTLTKMVDASPQMAVAYNAENFDEAKTLFFDDKVHGIILIPHDYERKIYRGEQAAVVAYADATYFMLYKQILSGTAAITTTLGAKIEVARLMQKGTDMKRAVAQSQPIKIETSYLFNPAAGYGSYAMPGILILILQQVLLLCIGMLGGTNREQGRQYYFLENALDPKHAASILLGKVSAFLTLHIFNVFFLLIVVYRIFNFPHKGSPMDLVLFLVPYLLAVSFLGVAIASLIKKREHSLVFMFFTSIPFIFMSGFSWPANEMPIAIQKISMLIPSTPAMQGYLRLNTMGASLGQVSKEFFHLFALMVLYFIVAYIMLRHRIIQSNRQIENIVK